SMATLPSSPVTFPSASPSAPDGTATSTTSALDASPPSLPSSCTSCPALRQRAARPPPMFPLPMVVMFMGIATRRSPRAFPGEGYTSNVRVLATVIPRKTVYGARGFPIPSSAMHYGEPPIPSGSVLVKLGLAVHDATGLDRRMVETAVRCESPDAEPRTLP